MLSASAARLLDFLLCFNFSPAFSFSHSLLITLRESPVRACKSLWDLTHKCAAQFFIFTSCPFLVPPSFGCLLRSCVIHSTKSKDCKKTETPFER